MPEGDTIWRAAAVLHSALAGRTVVEARPSALMRLKGARLDEVAANGKHLLMRFSGGWTLHSHMRMRGSWRLYEPGERWRRPEWTARAVLDFGDRVAVCFGAPVLDLVRNERAAVGHLGPDLAADEVDMDHVVRRARSLGAVALGELLLDQRVCAGIGNVYRCEGLWDAQLSPWRSAAEVSDGELRALIGHVRDALRSNLAGPDRRRRFAKGRPPAVYARAGRSCPRCGQRITQRRQGEHARLVYWCPGCQH